MIISKTPFRISYSGGGTDFPDYYLQKGALVFNTTIDKYLYVTVNKKFDGKIHIRYSRIEEVVTVDELQHDIIKECLKLLGIKGGIEVVTISDVPSKGSGLGSSSALTIGVLNALYGFIDKIITNEKLAEIACYVEIDLLKHPIGKQDQIACAIGGFKRIEFKKDGSIDYKICDERKVKFVENNSMLFYLGFTRNANDILKEHKDGIINGKEVYLDSIKELALVFDEWMKDKINFSNLPVTVINQSWDLKKKLSSGYSNTEIDSIFEDLYNLDNDIGAKCCGAGGGGFLLVYAVPHLHKSIRTLLSNLHELTFKFTNEGSRIIYADTI